MAKTQTETNPEQQAEYTATLRRRAAAITSVRNDVYAFKLWQMLVNFALAGIAIAGLIVSMAVDEGALKTAFTVIGVVFAVIFLVVFFSFRTLSPSSFQQFTCIDRGKTYRYQVFSPKRTAFSDGVNNIEVERGAGTRLRELTGAVFRYDFFIDMKEITRTESDGKETFSGTITHDGKTLKCKITFDGEKPTAGEIDGARIKYFDINNTKQKFIVPTELRAVVKEMGVPFPKIVGLHVRDDKTNRGKL